MSGMIVSQRGKQALVAGLEWRTLFAAGRARKKEIRQQVKAVGASRITVFDAGHSTAVGLYVQNDLLTPVVGEGPEETPKAPGKLYSLASAFGKMVGVASAVLVFELPDGRAAVCAVTAGLPIQDAIYGAEEAQLVANRYASGSDETGVSHEVYTNNGNTFRGHPIDAEVLWAQAGPSTMLASPPANVVALVGLVVACGMVAGGFLGYESWSKARELERRKSEAAASDPRPKYNAELQIRMGELGVGREKFVALLSAISQQRTYSVGWALTEVTCAARSQECVWIWARDAGTTADLVRTMAPMGLQPADTSRLDLVTFTSKFPAEMTGLADQAEFVPLDKAVERGTHVLQLWDNAGVPPPAAAAYTMWPTVPGVNMQKMPIAEAIKSRPFVVSVPLAWAADVIRSAPDDVWWTDFKITVGGESADVNINLLGASYVQ